VGAGWSAGAKSVGKLRITVLSGIAEFERDLILQQTNDGRARAMAEGSRGERCNGLTSLWYGRLIDDDGDITRRANLMLACARVRTHTSGPVTIPQT
jgi:DNA invertase Pin-like site-specific DNA recombinase